MRILKSAVNIFKECGKYFNGFKYIEDIYLIKYQANYFKHILITQI